MTVTFSVTQILAHLIEERVGFEAIQSLIPIAGGQVQVTEVMLKEGSPAIGKTLQMLDLPEGLLIGCIVRQDSVIIPRGWTQLQLGDQLILLTQNDNQAKGLAKLVAAEAQI